MNKELNCLQRPENQDLIQKWEIVRNFVRIMADIYNVDLSNICLVEGRGGRDKH